MSRSEPVELRYFSPESVAAAGEHAEPGCGARLRLGRVTPSDQLQSRIARRESPVEVGFYETLRWTEPPDDYVRRALVRELFELRGLAQSTSRRDPTLDVEVVGFEEARVDGRPAGRVQLRYQLQDGDGVTRGEITRQRLAQGADIAQVVAAIGGAMADATSELASRVVASLCAPGRAPEQPRTSAPVP
ncbi:MAG TPA: ABC-type transport auxiliary lipoprotein family protein [Kofleriaceae bacterium]